MAVSYTIDGSKSNRLENHYTGIVLNIRLPDFPDCIMQMTMAHLESVAFLKRSRSVQVENMI